MTDRNDTDPLFPPPPKPAEEGERVEKPIAIKSGYTPDVFKVKTAESKGNANAMYQSAARAPHSGEDTRELEPPVILDETKKEGFSGRAIRELMAEIEVERQRGDETVSIEATPKVPKKRNGAVLLGIGALVVICALVVVIAKSQTTTPAVVPVSVASSSSPTSNASIEVPPVLANSSAVVASATPTVSSPNIQASSTASTHAKAPSSGLALPPSSTHPTTIPSAPSSAHHVGDVPPGVL